MAKLKVLVVRSEEGAVTESRIVEGEFFEVVKQVASEAFREWDPSTSDFIVMRDYIQVEVSLPLDPGLFDFLRDYGQLARGQGGKEASIIFPFFTISFDNEMIDEENFVDKKIYIVAPYVNDDVKIDIESEAARMTSAKEKPAGIVEG